MSIRIGIYDFFAYTIPGSLYLFAITYVAMLSGLIVVDFQWLNSLSAIQAIVLAILAYITGLVFDSVAKVWYRLFKQKDLSKKILDDFKQAHADWDIKFQPGDWPILLKYLKRVNVDIASDIDKFNATNIMLRNISMGLLLLSTIEIVQLIRSNFLVWHLVFLAVFAILSIVTGRESVKFASWFFSATYEAITAYGMEIADLITRKQKTEPTNEVTSG